MTFGFRSADWRKKRTAVKTISDYKMEALVRFGREQIMRLRNKGINLPVALL